MATIKTLENYVLVKENENLEPLSYNYVWLRENCRCTECYNSTTYQRNILPLDIPHNIKPTSVTLSENTLHVTWSDNHVSEYCSTWLQSLGEAEKRPESILWSGDINNKVSHVSKDDLSSQSGLKQLVQSILQYGVGFVTQVPTNVKATEEVINKIGLPLHTFYGAGMWEFADTLDYLDTSYTNIELGAHTDTTYFIEPAGLIIFHCTQHNGEGGKTLLVDGFRAAKDVKLADPKLYNCLKTVSTEFSCIDREYHFTSCKPTLSFTPQDQLELVRYNVYDRSARIPGPRNEVDIFYKSLKLYGDAIKKTSGEWWFKLQPGTVAFVNNWRVLHGRSAYTGYRKIIVYTKLMDVLNKFCNTVSTTVSQLSTVLPGNPVTREYEVTSHIASAGTGLLWKIYSGYKKSTKQEASIFVFEKRQLERWSRQDRDEILNALKRGVSQLTRIRHPQVLVVHHPAEDSRDSLAFATEPVFASLANILGKVENTASPPNPQHKNYKLFEVEIKYGLVQVGEGLAFLHNDAKILHHNLCPENIVINQQGAWKIFGFDFFIQKSNHDSPSWPWVEYKADLHPLTQPELDYLAPECIFAESNSGSSDVYSLGIIICALYNEGQPLFTTNKDLQTYKQNIIKVKQLSSSNLLFVAEGLRDMVRMMLNVKPELRPDEHELIKVEFFDDVGVKTLNYLDSLFQWDNLQKSQFYKGLPQIIDKLPYRVCLYRVIPCLVKEFVNPTMVPFVLPNVLSIAENCSKEEFSLHILPHLKTVMKMTDPIQILLIFMQKMDLLLKLTPSDEVKVDVLPMLYRALESDAQQIQELCLSVLPTFAGLIEYHAMKNALLPRIKRLCISTSYISVRVNCLVCLGKLLEHLDKWLVLDEVLPFLPQIPSREPAVLMGILGIYKLVLTHKQMVITKEVMATKILPFLMPLSIENALTLNQFNAIIAVIKEMVNRVETEHRVKLEQLNSIQNEQKSLDSSMNITPLQTDIEQILGIKSPSIENKSLSMDDKQRYIHDQEASQRLRNEPSLNPTHSTVVKPLQPTKDLTASLMENNLNQMVISPVQQQSKIWPTPTPTPSLWANNVVNNTNSLVNWQTKNMHQTMPVPVKQPYIFPAAPFQSVNNKVPMNSMPTLSLTNSNKPFQQQPTKQLSSSEINDFLS